MLSKQSISSDNFMQAIEEGSLIITGNLRLARHLIQQYDIYIAAKGKAVWRSGYIMPWNNWLLEYWQEQILAGRVAIPKLLLSPEQELQVWKQIITASEQWNGLLRINATAKQIQKSWQLVNDWKVELSDEKVLGNFDAEIFLQWMKDFKQHCRAKQWLSHSLIPLQLLEAETLMKPGYSRLILTGFDEFTPVQHQLLSQLDIKIDWLELKTQSNNAEQIVVRFPCADTYDEIKNLSHWLRQQREINSDYKIGVVVPELSKYREKLIHAINLSLAPSQLHPATHTNQQTFNLSLGKPLSDYALVANAFLLFEMLKVNKSIGLDVEVLSQLLRSPFISGWETEMQQRAMLDRRIRSKRQEQVSFKTICYYAGQNNQPFYSPIFYQLLKNFQEERATISSKANCMVCAKQLGQFLALLGWSKGRSLNSEEFQVYEAWKKILGKLSSMAAVMGKIDINTAVSILHSLASETLFQAQSKSTPIQIMGLYEATGLQFDALWVMGLHDAIWPAKASPNNYIPLNLQRQLKLPNSSANRELQVAKTITKRLIHSAAQVIVSYPCQGEQNEELAASPLIESFKAIDRNDLKLLSYSSWQQQVANSSKMQPVAEQQAPPIESSKVNGGSSLFKYQAACPFRAFAEFRLKAKPFEQAEPGLDALQRGGLVHKALELAWREIHDHQNLLFLKNNGQLPAVLEKAIINAISDLQGEFQASMGQRFIDIEVQRIKSQLLQWYELEAQRAPFAVERLEEKLQSEINGILVDIVIDRIDILPDQRRILIDYKTGGVKPSQWFGLRPEEPQLPLYSSVVKDNKAAVLFAQLKTGEVTFKGIVSETDLIPNLPPRYGDAIIKEAAQRWDEILQEWLLVMQKLAGDFRQGKADVDPKDDQSCQYCQLATLCRIDELQGLLTQGEVAHE